MRIMNTVDLDLKIRRLTNEDLDAGYSLIRDIYASTDMMCHPFDEKYPDVESFERDLTEYNATEGAIFLVAETAHGFVGYLTVKPVSAAKLAHTAYLNMGVSENARRRAVGRRLLSAALNQIVADGKIEILYLNVRADNFAAVKLYLSEKFEVIAELERDTKIGDRYYTGLLMRRFIGNL